MRLLDPVLFPVPPCSPSPGEVFAVLGLDNRHGVLAFRGVVPGIRQGRCCTPCVSALTISLVTGVYRADCVTGELGLSVVQ
jgi:hypothetical protein